jgi:hypothetical protein
MPDDFLIQQIRRTNRNLFLLGILLLAGLALGLFAGRREVLNYFLGPFPVAPAALIGEDNPETAAKYFVKVRAEHEFFTGLNEYPQNGDRSRVIASYYAVEAGSRFLLVRSNQPVPRTEYTGMLVRAPQALITSLAKSPLPEINQLKAKALPVLLDTDRSPRKDWAMPFTALIFLAVGAGVLFRAVSRMAAPQKHPARIALARYGDPSRASIQLDAELRMEREEEKWKSLRLTRNWLLYSTVFNVRLTQMRDLVWVYPKIVRHFTYFFPTGRSHSIVIRDRAGQSIEISTKKDTGSPLLAALQQRAPWIVMGYNDDYEKAWRSDRPKFIAAVDQRRAALR